MSEPTRNIPSGNPAWWTEQLLCQHAVMNEMLAPSTVDWMLIRANGAPMPRVPEEGPMETYMGYMYGVRFYNWPIGLRCLVGGYSTLWYAKCQRARCKATDGPRRSAAPPHYDHACGINNFSIIEAMTDGGGYDSCVGSLDSALGPDPYNWEFPNSGFTFTGRREFYPTIRVAAVCRSWGKIVVADRGFRASDTEVLTLSLSRASHTKYGAEMEYLLTGPSQRAGFGGVPILSETPEEFQDRCNAEYMAADIIQIPEQEGVH